jgi:hypothetical protein
MVEDGRIIWTCCKNNDGELGPRSAWIRQNGLFQAVEEFDWEEFDKGEGKLKLGWKNLHEKLKEHFGAGLLRKQTIVKFLEAEGINLKTAYKWIEKAVTEGFMADQNGLLSV